MDDGLSRAVREVFVRLYHEGLIYRGKRLINWCPRCLTALSDIEVQHEDISGRLYHIRYPLADDPQKHVTVATTRPETMLGDTGVAVHPDDPRYNSLIGQEAQVEEEIRERIAGQSPHEAREIIVEALERAGLLLKVEDHPMALGKCYRCKTVVEPYLSPQWFVKITSLAEPAIKAVETGQIRLIPEQWTNNYL